MKAKKAISFDLLVSSIVKADTELSVQAARAVNISLTLRNWLIGFYIAEFEQRGADRAEYGEQLLKRLAERLATTKISNTAHRQLYNYKAFYSAYPSLADSIAQRIQGVSIEPLEAVKISPTAQAKSRLDANQLLLHLSYSHFALLTELETDIKRAFYEVQCFQGQWSTRELKRQIGTLLFEHTALSIDLQKTVANAQLDAEKTTPRLELKDPYIFEFLGLKSEDIISESMLESRLLEKISDFILELGNGFCFEARQKRILIGAEHFFVDLVFYHRILKCHVLIELKTGDFTHEYIGQLNTYVTWYKRHMMSEGDNPPIGVLLCNQKNQALVEYALAGMDNDLFVSKYLLELPNKDIIQRFLEETLKEQL